MAITPQQADTDRAAQKQLVDRCEKKLDKLVERDYEPGKVLNYPLPNCFTASMSSELENRYREVGWQAQVRRGQTVKGAWCSITLSSELTADD
jgi:hypothetical protein